MSRPAPLLFLLACLLFFFAPGVDEDALMEAAMEADADDVVTHEDGSTSHQEWR